MLTALYTVFALLLLSTIALTFIAAFMAGKQSISARMLVEAKRRERRLNDKADEWANKYLEKTNATPLWARQFSDDKEAPKPNLHRVVPPSEAIAKMKKVPTPVKEAFLADTSRAA